MIKTILLAFLLVILILTNVQAQMFEEQSSFLPQLSRGDIAYGDFDQDGDQDILVTGSSEQNLPLTKIFRNDNGKFTELNTGIENLMLSTAVWADLNNDKYPEIIISGKNSQREAVTLIYRNWKNGTFTPLPINIAGISSGSIAVADYNKDGLPDILITGLSANDAISKLIKNNGFFEFSETGLDLVGVYNSSSKFVDLNNDTYPDILISGETATSRYTKLYINQKDGTFNEVATKLPQLGNGSIACADLNNDNNPDIIISGLDMFGNEKTELFSNDGNLGLLDTEKTRGFIKTDYAMPNLAYGTINFADLDGDNDLDLILTGKGSQKISAIYSNEGNFNFKKTGIPLNGVYHSALTVFDYNNDKNPDIFYFGLDEQDNAKSFVFLNKGIGNLTNIKASQPIKPAFNFSLVSIGKATQFNNMSTSNINGEMTYKWNFGDESFSSEKNPEHTYAKPGRYTVVLAVNVNNTIETATKVVYVKPEEIQSVSFSDRENLIINTEAISLLEQYEKLINHLGELPSSKEKEIADYKEQIINLFLNRQISVYNDLDPTHSKSKLQEIETYTSDLLLLYPDGMTVSIALDKARMKSIKQHGKNLYSVDIIANKRIDGNYKNETQNATNEDLTFRIAFNKDGSSFSNFKFVGIRDILSQSFTQDENEMEEINKVELDPIQKEQIDKASAAVLNDYIRNLALIGSPNEENDEKDVYEKAFVELFSSTESSLFNDIDPDARNNSFLPADYIKQYRALYPSGISNISLNIDSALYKPVLNEDENLFYRYVYANKNFSGVYKAKNKNSIAENLAFKIVFVREKNSFQNFKIYGIDQSALNFYQAGEEIADADTLTFVIKSIGRKGFSAGITATAGMGSVYDKNLLNEQVGGVNLYTTQPSLSYSAGVEINYFFSDKLSLRSGLYYSSYASDYSINNGDYSDEPNIGNDLNGDSYFKHIVATNYKQTYKLSTIDLPVQLQWISSKPRSLGFYVRGGVNLSIPIKAMSQKNGNLQYYGEYPDNPDVLKILTIPALGFYDIAGDGSDTEFNSNNYSMSIMASAGISIPIGYFLTINAGPELMWGITDLYNQDKFTNIFGEETDNLGTTLRNYGFNVSLLYKF